MRRFLALACLLVVALPAAAAHARRPMLGIADQKALTFQDDRFLALGLHTARLNLPWDVLSDPPTLEAVDAWMLGARVNAIGPLVTIDRSRRPGRQSLNPTPAQITAAVAGWRARWPGQIRALSAWNEGNINKRPELVAKWWLAARRACPGCTVLGADLVDRSNAASWARRFVKAAKRRPVGWGLHAYNDANTFSTKSTRAFLKGTKGEVWLTETGGVVTRANPRYAFGGCGYAHAARATDFLLRRIAPMSKRITHVYLYSWSTGPQDTSWDSGLIGPTGQPRPALDTLRRWLGLGAQPADPDAAPDLAPAAPCRSAPAKVAKKAAKKPAGKAAKKAPRRR
jgi:hypothetical protein